MAPACVTWITCVCVICHGVVLRFRRLLTCLLHRSVRNGVMMQIAHDEALGAKSFTDFHTAAIVVMTNELMKGLRLEE